MTVDENSNADIYSAVNMIRSLPEFRQSIEWAWKSKTDQGQLTLR